MRVSWFCFPRQSVVCYLHYFSSLALFCTSIPLCSVAMYNLFTEKDREPIASAFVGGSATLSVGCITSEYNSESPGENRRPPGRIFSILCLRQLCCRPTDRSRPWFCSPIMSRQFLDTPSKHAFSITGLADRALNHATELVLSAGWSPLTKVAEAGVVAYVFFSVFLPRSAY